MKSNVKILCLASSTLLYIGGAILESQADPLLIDGKSVEDRQKEKVLKGKVQEKVFRDFGKNFSLPSKPAMGFNLSAQQQTAAIENNHQQQHIPGKDLIPKTDFFFSDSSKTGNATQDQQPKKPPISDQGTVGAVIVTDKKPVVQQKRVIVRVRRVVSLMEAEIAEGAIKTALNMLRKDPESNVTVFLDLDAVSLADGDFNYFDQFSTGEDGNMRVISLKYLRSLLTTFGGEGGKIIVSEHWAKVKGFRNKTNTIVSGCDLLDDDAIAEILLSATNVIDY